MKKLIYSIIILFAVACKPEKATEPEKKDCPIQKISYDDGSSNVFKFNADNRLTEIVYNYEYNGKMEALTIKFDYNAAGNLLKTTNSENYIDDYIYDANGVLTRIDFKDQAGKIYEQFTIKLDAQKRLTNVVTLKDGLSVNYEYKGPGGLFSGSTVYSGNVMTDDYQIKSYETDNTKKYYFQAIKGHLFDPILFTDDMIYSNPLNFSPSNLMINTVQASTNYDENWENLTTKSRVYWDATFTRKYNEKNFVIQEEWHDKIENEKSKFLYDYAICN